MRPSVLRRALALAAAVVTAGMPLEAAACGACIEDKIAATYDHAVIEKASRRHHVVVFAAIEGNADAAAQRSLRAAALRARGVDATSVRASRAPQALSFALDPTAGTPRAVLESIERNAHARGVKLVFLRTM